MSRLSWDKQFEDGVALYGPRSENTIRLVQSLCRGGRMIEFGCGEGDLPLVLAAGTFSSYLGFDISEVAVKRARSKAAGSACILFQQGDMAHWCGGDTASLILAEECLYYLSLAGAETFLLQCMRCLSKNGSMLVIVHSASKHTRTINLCRRVCLVQSETVSGERVFLTLAPRPGNQQ